MLREVRTLQGAGPDQEERNHLPYSTAVPEEQTVRVRARVLREQSWEEEQTVVVVVAEEVEARVSSTRIREEEWVGLRELQKWAGRGQTAAVVAVEAGQIADVAAAEADGEQTDAPRLVDTGAVEREERAHIRTAVAEEAGRSSERERVTVRTGKMGSSWEEPGTAVAAGGTGVEFQSPVVAGAEV